MVGTRKLVDAIVIGGHVGPLVAACLLARRGFKVIHVEHDGLSEGYRDNGHRFPLAPEILPGPRSSPVISEILKTLALNTDAQRLLREVEASLQILSPGHRLALGSEPAARGRELGREFGNDEGAVLERTLARTIEADAALGPFLAALPPLPPEGLREKRAARRAAANADLEVEVPAGPAGHPVTAALRALGRLSTYLWAPEPTAFHRVRSTARLLHGIHRSADVAGSGYGAMLRRRLRELGGESVGGGTALAEEVRLEGGRVVGLKVLDDPTDYRCRFLLSGVDTAALRRLLPLEGRRKRYDSTLDSVRARSSLFSTNLLLAEEGWPVGLGELAIYVRDPAAEPEEENLLILQRFDALREDGPEAGRVVLQVSCFLSAKHRQLGADYLEQLQSRCLEVLRADLMPFLDRHLERVSSPYLSGRRDAGGARLAPHPLLETDLRPAYGVGVLPSRTPYKNLVLVGREVVPGLGIEGEFLTGLRAADLVGAASRRHDPLKDQ